MGFFSGLLDFGKSLVSPLIGGAASLYGARQANIASGDRLLEQQRFSAAQAKRQMDFQRQSVTRAMQFSERMAGSTFQRGMADMRSAGLNPILAFKQGGAPSPGGVSASGAAGTSSVVPAIDEVGPAVASALQTKRLGQELDNMRAIEARTKEERERTWEDKKKVRQDRLTSQANEQLLRNQNELTAIEKVKRANEAIRAGEEAGTAKHLRELRRLEAKRSRDWGESAFGRMGESIERMMERLGQNIGKALPGKRGRVPGSFYDRGIP